MTPNEWLDSTVTVNGVSYTVLDRLAELIAVNGGLKVHGWGCHGGGGPYGRTGLSQEEALELIEYDGILYGFSLALGAHYVEGIAQRVRERIARQESMPRFVAAGYELG